MLKRLLVIISTLIIAFSIFAADSDVKVNSIGFIPVSDKEATVSGSPASFTINDASTDAVVYSAGTVSGNITVSDSAETVRKLDFTNFETVGTYYVDVPGIGRSTDFVIAEDVWNSAYYTAMRGMYLWRCGTAVDGWHNGNHYTHAACHMNDGYEDYTTGMHVIRDGTKGWHDAGDYGKYTVNAGITVGMMFKAWELWSGVLDSIPLDLPVTASGYPEYLQEMKWETDYILTMQYTDGSGKVSHKLTRLNFSGFVMPENDTADRYFTDWSSAATADFVAMMAMAARIFEPYDSAYAATCLSAAWESYNFLLNNTANKNADLTDFSTGGYGTTDTDDRLWAAAEMWETTGDATALADLNTRANNYTDKTDAEWGWTNVKNLGMYTYLLSARSGKNTTIVNDIQNDLIQDANTIANTANNHGYGRGLGTNYYWGCNGSVAGTSMNLMIANEVSPNQNYIDAAQNQLGYLFGRNYHRRSYVTGLGVDPPMNPHDRRSGADGILDPWPGYLVGGSPGSGQDPDLAAAVPAGQPVAYYWADIEGSYSSNEIAINWQGALIFALAAFAVNPATPTETPTWDPYIDTYTPTETSTPEPLPIATAECGTISSIDGNLNDAIWQTGNWITMDTGNLIEGTNPDNVSAQFKVRWDATNVYIAVDVTDNNLVNDSAAQWYNDDSVEIYFDMNDSNGTPYDGDDYQYSMRYNDTVLREQGGNDAGCSAASMVTAGGWSVEFELPWTTLGVTPSEAATYGFDVGINFDQDGTARDGVLMWEGNGNNWQDTTAFGDLYLGSCAATETPTESFTDTSTDTATDTPTETFTVTSTDTDTITQTPTETYTETFTETSTETFTETFTDTITETPTETDTVPPGSTDTYTPTETDTETVTETFTETETPVDSQTETFTETETETLVPTESETPTITDTIPPGSTDTMTPTDTFTETQTNVPETETFTFTETQTETNVPPTYTYTATHTFTGTSVYTETLTPTPTITNTPVAEPTKDELVIDDIFVYPNPVNPETVASRLNLRFNLSQNAGELRLRVYTTSFRCILDEEITDTGVMGLNIINYKAARLRRLANGTYYFVIMGEDNKGQTVRSSIEQFIILR